MVQPLLRSREGIRVASSNATVRACPGGAMIGHDDGRSTMRNSILLLGLSATFVVQASRLPVLPTTSWAAETAFRPESAVVHNNNSALVHFRGVARRDALHFPWITHRGNPCA